jgi:hypothetical protein
MTAVRLLGGFWLGFVVGLLLLPACGVDEGAFLAGSDGVPCQENVPVCQTSAGCIMGESRYVEGNFPGIISFVVTTPADTIVAVKLFFKGQINPGEDTEIIWYEPGCGDKQIYMSGVDDIFSLTGEDGVFSQEKKVRRAGDHLIEIESDAYTHFFARVELDPPE